MKGDLSPGKYRKRMNLHEPTFPYINRSDTPSSLAMCDISDRRGGVFRDIDVSAGIDFRPLEC